MTVNTPQVTPQPLRTLLASAQRLTSKKIQQNRGAQAITAAAWQADAWDMFDLVGEQHFLVTTLAAKGGQARLFVGELNEFGEDPIESPKYGRYLRSIGTTSVGRTQLLTRLFVNLSMAGEGWLVGLPQSVIEDNGGEVLDEPVAETAPEGEPLPESSGERYFWKVLSVSEVAVNSATEMVKLDWGDHELDKIEVSPDDIYLIRIWRPHPRYWQQADSPTRALIPVLRELVGLTMHISAQVDSRLAGAGLLLVPQSAQRALRVAMGMTPDPVGDEGGDDPFTDALMEAMLTPISDRASASALVPLVVTVPDDAASLFNFITFAKPLDTESRNLREEAIRRLALGQDAPPELLLGTASMNHWGAWLLKQETVQAHIEPPLALICDALTTQYLWAAMRDDGIPEEVVRKHVIWYDVSHMVSRPNQSQDAFTLHERGAIRTVSLLRSAGFEESDGFETPEDLSIVLSMVRENPALIEKPGVEALLASVRVLLGLAPRDSAPPPVEDAEAVAETEETSGEPEAEAEETGGEGSGEVPVTDAAPPPAQEPA